MTTMMHDGNVVRRLTREVELDVRPDLFNGPDMMEERPDAVNWEHRVPLEIRAAWWELDDRTRRLIALLADRNP